MSDQTNLEGKVALVTGASRGIGRAIALTLGQRGATVVGTATSEKGAEAISAALDSAGISGVGMVLNVCEPDSLKAIVPALTERFAAPSILVNNAAITKDGLMLRMSPADWDAVIQTNLNSVFHLSKAVLKGMSKARWGRIVNISSVVARSGNPGQANYCAAKAGVEGFTRSLANEMASRGITVNAVAPGFIQTDMTAVLIDDQKKTILDHVPAGRLGQPEEIAAAVAFLASELAGYITGQVLAVNGGMSMV
ncbi:MAG: 3-oxoacyl-ACP reductase FabG [Gammaproteobacteria bacterium]